MSIATSDWITVEWKDALIEKYISYSLPQLSTMPLHLNK